MKLFVTTIIGFVVLGCSSCKTEQANAVREKKTESFYTCELIEKEFVNKIGDSSGVKE